jgi:hypothetical protein
MEKNLVEFTYPNSDPGTTGVALFELVHPWPDENDSTIHPLTTIISQRQSVFTRAATLIGNGPGNGGA